MLMLSAVIIRTNDDRKKDQIAMYSSSAKPNFKSHIGAAADLIDR